MNHEKGDGKVADYLVKHGYSKITRENGKLLYVDESFVGHVIRNETYCGMIVYGKRKNVKDPKTGKVTTKTRGRSEWYRAEGLHEPIISRDLFEQAQEIRKKNTYYQPKVYNPKHAAVFSGLLICPVCGAHMHGVGGLGKVKLDGKHGGGSYYYSCSNHRRKKGEHQCPYSKGWRQDKIDALMANVIGQIAGNDLFRGNLNDRLGKTVETDEYEEQAERIKKQIRNKTKTLKRKALTIDNFDWDVKNADSLYDSLNNDYVRLHNEVQALEESLEEVTAMIDKINNRQVTKDGVFKFLMEFGRIYNKLPEINKKELANKFIEKIEIFPEEQEDGSVIKSVTFRFPLKSNGDKIGVKGGTGLTTGTPVETVVLLRGKKLTDISR